MHSFVIFVVFIPVVIFYASGYRIGKNWQVVEIGGIYATSPFAGSRIFVDGVLSGETGGFWAWGRSYAGYIAGEHEVKLEKDGYSSWSKKVLVQDNQVSDADSFLVPMDSPPAAVAPSVSDDNGNPGSESRVQPDCRNFRLPGSRRRGYFAGISRNLWRLLPGREDRPCRATKYCGAREIKFTPAG